MKKVLLLSALVASVASFAGTTGSVEVYSGTSTPILNKSPMELLKEGEISKLGVKTEVKVKDSGLSFGTEVGIKNFKPFAHKMELGPGEVWVKYEIPQFNGVDTYVKASLNKEVRLTLEGNAKTTVSGVELGLNSKLAATLLKTSKPALVLNGYAKTDVSVIKDAKLELETKYNFKESSDSKNTGFEYVSGVLSGKYNDIKDLELNGKISLKYQFTDKSKFYDVYLNDDSELKEKNLVDTYELSAKYTGIDKTTLKGTAALQHIYSRTDSSSKVTLGLKGEAEYKGIDNLTLSGSANARVLTTIKAVSGVKLGLTAKGVYEYKATDKLTVSPELGGEYNLTYDYTERKASHDVTLTPAVKAEYKPVESLTLIGKASLPVKFETKDQNALAYAGTNLKTELNIKYTW